MKRVERKAAGKMPAVIMETYSTFDEFIQTCDNRDLTTWASADGSGSRGDSDNPWRGNCTDYRDAANKLLKGSNENVARMVTAVKGLQRASKQVEKTRTFHDVAGYMPDVPRAIMGLPDSMINSKKVPVESKIITLIINPAVSASTSAEQVVDFGSRVINGILNLEKSGYRVRVEYMDTKTSPGAQHVLRVPIKNENNPLNIKRMAFPLTNVSMLRYLAFDWYERLPGSTYISGYGVPLEHATKAEKDSVNNLLRDDEILIKYGDDVESILGQVK